MSITRSLIILVVDDSMLWLERISMMLYDLQSVRAVLTAKSFDEALPLFKTNPDIILLDINLPGRNGIEILKFIKTNYASPKIGMVSNSINALTRKTLESLGAHATFDKSKEFERIPDFINNNLTQAK